MSCPFAKKGSTASNPHRRAGIITAHLATDLQPVDDADGENYRSQRGGKFFESIPGPPKEDMEAYRMGNHWYVAKLHDEHGDIIKLKRDGRDVVFVRDAKSIRQVLLDEDDFAKTFDADDISTNFLQYLMNIMQPLLREAEVFGSADNSKQRAIMRRTFMSSEEFLPGFAKAIDRALEREEFWKEGPTEIMIASHMLVFEAVMVIIMGENTSYTSEFYDESTNVLRYYEHKYSQPMFDMEINEEDAQAPFHPSLLAVHPAAGGKAVESKL